ncbi:unnamed protein product [Sphagnum jensenii]|uniref:Peptidase A1 domain-containing protein n=1 Tax=Sphagnum jensenii TaxID=128206 RepID=A0ABP0WZ85_9BRYO
MESLLIRRAPGVLLLVVAIMLQASTQICLGRQILSTGSGRPSDDEISTTQEVNYDKVSKSYWIHRDHPDSPASAASTYNTSSQSERIAAAARRSLARAEYFSRRVLDDSSSGNFDSPVEAVGGDYAMAVSVGTPPQQFLVNIDTGSDLVWVNCQPCIQCIVNASHNPFDPSQSTSYREASCTDAACTGFPNSDSSCVGTGPCDYIYGYGEGTTTSGIVAYEAFTFTALDGSSFAIGDVTFGCGQNETLNGFPGIDGLVGLAQGSFSLPSQLSSAPGFTDIFSYCLIPFDGTAANYSTFYFGVPETNISTYTPIYSNAVAPSLTFYYVYVTGISVGDVLLDIPADFFNISATDGSGGIIFDSGTTLNMLIGVAYDAVLQEFENQFSFPIVNNSYGGSTVCFDVSSATASTIYPNIVFHLQSVSGGEPVDFVLYPENVFLPPPETDVLCLTIMSINSPGPMIIGNTAQADHEMVFDRVNNQIGWASTTCT